MFEYLNVTLFVILVIILSIDLASSKKKDTFINTIIVFSLFILVIIANLESQDAIENVEAFNASNSLICKSGRGMYNEAIRYSVSKKEGWRLEKSFFIKDSLLIATHKCKLN